MISEERGEDFYAQDATGRARVIGAKVELVSGAAEWQHWAPPQVRRFVAERGQWNGQRLRWCEETLRKGDTILLAGVARWHTAGAEEPRDGYHSGGRKVLWIDAPDDGWIRIERTSR